jgi:hypothetical protein
MLLLLLLLLLVFAGLDMTPAQLDVAQRHSAAWQQQLGYAAPNMRFLQVGCETDETCPSSSCVWCSMHW